VHLDHEQKYSASAGLSWRAGQGVSVSADALFGTGLRDGFANTLHLPGYAVLNLAAAKTFGKTEVRVGVDNLFDRIYELRDGTGIGVGAPQYGMRRSVQVTVTQSF